MIKEFDRICKKHNLKYWAIGGTLLGAARHKGYIPWDDDVDLVMFRPDYEKFRSIVQSELPPQYFFYAWYNYRLESDENLEEKSDPNLPLISIEQQKKYPVWVPFFPLLRIVDKRTTAIGFGQDRKNVFTGIFIDVFCFDPVPPFTQSQQMKNYAMAKELLFATILPDTIKECILNRQKLITPTDFLINIMKLPYKKRAEFWEFFNGKNFFESERVYHLKHLFYEEEVVSYAAEDFSKTVYLPFEKIEIPCPGGYNRVLRDKYGDWHKLSITHTHSLEFSVDVPYTEYFRMLEKAGWGLQTDKFMSINVS